MSLQGLMSTAAFTLNGCAPNRVTLQGVLEPARGCIAYRHFEDIDVDEVLSAARDKYATVSFGYIGCGGRVPLLSRIRSAVAGAIGKPSFHMVFDAVDEPDRYDDVIRDIIGDRAGARDPEYLRVAFVKKDDYWPRQSNKAVQNILQAMHVRYGDHSYLQTISETGLFGKDGTFRGIHYL
jgi:hypothetical protein